MLIIFWKYDSILHDHHRSHMLIFWRSFITCSLHWKNFEDNVCMIYANVHSVKIPLALSDVQVKPSSLWNLLDCWCPYRLFNWNEWSHCWIKVSLGMIPTHIGNNKRRRPTITRTRRLISQYPEYHYWRYWLSYIHQHLLVIITSWWKKREYDVFMSIKSNKINTNEVV